MEAQYIPILFLKKLKFYLCCHLDKLSQLHVKNGANSNLLKGWGEEVEQVCSVRFWLDSCFQVYRYSKGNKDKQVLGVLILSPLLLLFSHSVVSDSLRPHELHRARLPCPSLSPRVSSDSCPLNQWCYPTILSSVVPFSCPLSFPASKSFPMSQFFGSGSQSIGVLDSSSVLPSFPLLTEIFLLESFYYKPLEKRTLDQE